LCISTAETFRNFYIELNTFKPRNIEITLTVPVFTIYYLFSKLSSVNTENSYLIIFVTIPLL